MPAGSFREAACYEGAQGSREGCTVTGLNNFFTYSSTRELGSGEQMSIVTSLTKGAVRVPAPLLEARKRQFPQDAFDVNPLTVGIGLLLLLAGVGLIVRFWLAHGRDRAYLTRYYQANDAAPDRPEPVFQHEPVVVEFEPPQKLRPAELGLILDESADTKDVTATIVDLAVRGFLTISEVQGKRDWLLTRKSAEVAGMLPYEMTLFNGLFANRQQVKISELKGTFQSTLRAAEGEVYADAMSHKFFRARPDLVRLATVGVAILIALAGAGLTFLLGITFGGGLIGLAVVLVGVVLIVMHRAMASRTAAGREVMQKTLGFRLYMTTAEKYRQQFAEKAEIFTQLLPYAIVFGCVDRWSKAFEGIDTSAGNSWYVGNAPFQAAFLSSSLESMNSSLSNAIASTPPSSGSSSWFVLNAVFFHNLTVASGDFDVIKRALSRLTTDRRLQALLVAFSFGALIEGIAGFGAPVAISASILASLGFEPVTAAVLSLLANTAPVAFGSIGIPVTTLGGLVAPLVGHARDPQTTVLALSAMVGRQLPLFSVLVPGYLLVVLCGWRGMAQVLP